MEFHLAALPFPAAQGWVFAAMSAMESTVEREFTEFDASAGPQTLLARWNEQHDMTKCVVLALQGAPEPDASGARFGLPPVPDEPRRLLGSAYLALLEADNPHLADDCWIMVQPEARRRGIGTALWGELYRIATEAGRTSFVGFTGHRPCPECEQLPAPTGVGAVPVDAGSRFALACGFALEQAERLSVLDLPLPDGLLDRLAAQTLLHAQGYAIRTWQGPTPPDLLAGVAAMQATLSTDAPRSGIDWEQEAWDAERQRREDEVNAATGTSYGAVALTAAGEVVAYTLLVREYERPEHAVQWNTVVASAHRGHRLGLAVKVANLRQLAEAEDVGRVLTWNAGENDHMLAINTALGFRPVSVNGAWQLRVPQTP